MVKEEQEISNALNTATRARIGARLLPSAPPEDIRAIESLFGQLPDDLRSLLETTRGIDLGDEGIIRFDTIVTGMENVFPRALTLGTDDLGNQAILEIDRAKNQAGPILYFCHDPPCITVIARNLEEFFEAVLPSLKASKESPYLSREMEEQLPGTYPNDHGKGKNHINKEPRGQKFRSWKKSLPKGFEIYDLRDSPPGTGINWAKFGPKSTLSRYNNELIFAVAPRVDASLAITSKPQRSGHLHLSEVSDFSFPCVWFTGPSKGNFGKFGYRVVRRKWVLRATPFWPERSLYIPGGILDSEPD